MSRLDSFIRRLEAQRTLLDWAADAIGDRGGHVLEVGLGNGRTFDHLREKFPGRRIFAFDRANNAHPESVPPADHLLLGEFSETLPRFAGAHAGEAILIHADAGLGEPAANARQVARLSEWLPPLAASGALVLCDQNLSSPELEPTPLPSGVPQGRYFVFTRR